MSPYDELPKDLADALNQFRNGKFVLIHDSKSRENEVDLVVAAELTSPEHVKTMRQDAGGLLCVAVDNSVGQHLGIGYLQDVFDTSASRFPVLRDLAEAKEPYGDRPAFSITVNHRRTFTGVTDQDRALTILRMGKISKRTLTDPAIGRSEFITEFKSPGHVQLLLEAEGSIAQRRGHTELSLHLCRLARLTPATAICEMLDDKTYQALSMRDATAYARSHSLPLLDGEDLASHFSATSQTMPGVN